MVNVAEAPAVMDIDGGKATNPAGIGPFRLNTVAPPHSAELVPAGGHCVVSNTVTMKKYVAFGVTAI